MPFILDLLKDIRDFRKQSDQEIKDYPKDL